MLIIETDDPGLSKPAVQEVFERGYAAGVAEVRLRLTQCLPGDIARVVAVFAEEHAALLLKLHEAVGEDIAAELGEASPFMRPPSDYVPPRN